MSNVFITLLTRVYMGMEICRGGSCKSLTNFLDNFSPNQKILKLVLSAVGNKIFQP